MQTDSTATARWWPCRQRKRTPDTTLKRDQAAAGTLTRRGFPASNGCGFLHRNPLALLWIFVTLFAGNATGQSAPGTIIPNQADLSYLDPGGNPVTVQSNLIAITTVATRTVATLNFNRITTGGNSVPVGQTGCLASGGGIVQLGDPVLLGGVTIDGNQPQPLASAGQFHAGEPLFITLSDLDQNLDSNIRDSVEVTVSASPGGDRETLQLTETTVDSGLFAGYIQTAAGSAVVGDCQLQVDENSDVSGSYVDPNDAVDTDQVSALVDPLNIVFDSNDGQPLNGVTITLINTSTGMPAQVFGADGLSTFPSSITSGSNVTDSGGQIYAFPPGGFRFPVVPEGDYRLEIDPPDDYQAPSIVSIGNLQTLPNAPFELASGSFGDAFTVDNSLAFNLDVPVDPSASLLYLQKSTSNTTASPGDFIQYTLIIENTSDVIQAGVTIDDLLPAGFRLVPGSVLVNEVAVNDPAIGADGRSLTFAVGDLNPAESINIRYVTEVTIGARGEEAVNTALAMSSAGVRSNEAVATLQLLEELFTGKATVVGRAILGSCDEEVSNDFDGVGGIRIYMEDGRYAITDEGGRFHFEGLDPGTHVVQLDLVTVPDHLEVVDCRNNTRFAGRNFSRFVDLRAGSLWRADFHLREKALPAGNVTLELIGTRVDNDTIDYSLNLSGGKLPVDNVIATVILPKGFSFESGSAKIGDQPVDMPVTTTGTVSFRLGDRPAAWMETVRLRANLTGATDEQPTAKAVASFGMPNGENGQTPIAESSTDYQPEVIEIQSVSVLPRFANLSSRLNRDDKRKLNETIADWVGGSNLLLTAIGHTDSNRIEPGHIRFADNYALSDARALAVAEYVAKQLNIPLDQITTLGKGPDEPIADNATEAGRAENRRVELKLEKIILVQKASLGEQIRNSAPVNAETLGAHTISVDKYAIDVDVPTPAVFSEPGFIETLQPEIRWLAPIDGYSPPIPSMKLAIQHHPDTTVQIQVNGKTVDPLNFVGTETNGANTVAISRWRGVDIGDGTNTLTAIIRDGDGREIQKLETGVHYGGGPVRAEFDKAASRLIADGTSSPVLAVRLFDRYGEPARPSTTGAFNVDSPYRTLWESEFLTENQLIAVGDREPLYRVGPNGIAYLQLAPTTVTGEATVRLKFADNREEEIRVWIEPAPRDWILVGFAEGTLGHNTISDNMVTAEAAGIEEDTYTDGRTAFFAKGQVKGEYLLTLAYKSDVDKNAADGQLFGTIDPNRYYTLYGDTSEQRFEAASRRGLFLKIERREFYALFGDFQTGLSVTELSRYDRSLNGLKSEYRGDRFAYNAFASDTDKAFIRDEINGDGTSGPYRLSVSPLVINSDQIEIQIRDRFRSEVILETQQLNRYIDYSIDYRTGEIFMKRPVPSRDGTFNPVFIVANYETPEDMGENVSAGGRGSWFSENGRLEVGASVIHQGTEGDAGDLAGADLRFKVTDQTEVRAELATTETDTDGSNVGVMASVDHQSERLEARAWFQELEDGFGLGQQNSSETGMRKYGVDSRYGLTDRVNLVGSAFRQDNLVDDARQDVIEAEVQYQDSKRNASVGLIAARDSFSNGDEFDSNQLFASASTNLFNNLFTARSSIETSMGGSSASVNYPDRLLLGLDYNMSAATQMFTEVEAANGAGWDSIMTRVGVKTQPWQSAQLNSGLNHEMTEFGPRTFATVGLTQGWQATERWYFDLGLDQSRTMGSQPDGVNPDAPPASGSVSGEDFIASYIGALYRSDFWTFTSRAEFRDSDSEDRINLLGGFYREQNQGRGFSANLQWLNSEFDNGSSTTFADLRLGWAWRPVDSEWIIFDRIDLIYESTDNPLSKLETWKLINNLNANWMINRDTQLELQYGAKYVRSNFSGAAYTGYTDIVGAGLRRDLSERWDVGIHGDVLHSWQSDIVAYSWGVDAGFTLFENIWISAGYNFAGFRDDDFSGANFTAQGPYITFRIKADQQTIRDLFNRETDQ